MDEPFRESSLPLPPELIKELLIKPNLRWSSSSAKWVCKYGETYGFGRTTHAAYGDLAFMLQLTELLTRSKPEYFTRSMKEAP